MVVQRVDGTDPADSRLPDVSLTGARDGAPVSLRERGRFARIVVLLHDGSCEGCFAYLRELRDRLDDFQAWDGRVYAVVPGRIGSATRLHRALRAPIAVLSDPDHTIALRIGIDDAVVLVADQWGEVFLVTTAGYEHRFPSADELTDWLRFLAVRCPECEGEAL